ncbi:MAG: hypothetical protein JW845_01125 [Dehalococcoidales bacterium]|nr:hypothetical protein [Dehalococcoidales bacterium]
MAIDRQKVLETVYASIEMINEDREDKESRLELKEETRLVGRQSKLDSLKFVGLIIDIEQRLADELDIEISLTDEKAMSQARSPFRNVQSLVDYICSLEV